jgi:hypothetical protein
MVACRTTPLNTRYGGAGHTPHHNYASNSGAKLVVWRIRVLNPKSVLVDSSMVKQCSSIASTSMGLGGMAQWGIDGGHTARHARGGGAVWHHGVVDRRSSKFDAWIPIRKMSSRKMEQRLCIACDSARWGSAGPVGAPGLMLGNLARPPAFLWCALVRGHGNWTCSWPPLHQTSRFSVCPTIVASDWSLYSSCKDLVNNLIKRVVCILWMQRLGVRPPFQKMQRSADEDNYFSN